MLMSVQGYKNVTSSNQCLFLSKAVTNSYFCSNESIFSDFGYNLSFIISFCLNEIQR